MLEAAFIAGVCSEGVSVESLGVVPTPAVAFRSDQAHRPAAMISASHNPFADNGIKLFAPGGLKLSDAVQLRLEAVLGGLGDASGFRDQVPVGDQLGQTTSYDVGPAYLDHVVASIDPAADGALPLSGLRVVVDCANGAASALALDAFTALGASATSLHDRPDGRNINDASGSTHPEALQAAVVAAGADCGFAFDGDADRMLAVDAAGRLVDGDQLIAIAAIDLKSRGRLANDTVVVTVMTNLGFRIGMRRHGISVVDTAVGDRYVLEALDTGSFVLGGEQSGHIIFRDRATTGDGLLSAVTIAEVISRSGRPIADLADSAMTRLPQVLRNVRVAGPAGDVAAKIANEVRAVEAALGETGRVLVRASGTEPLVRVMVEATDEATAEHWAAHLADAVAALG